MLLTPESAITELRNAVPSFESEWTDDRLSYLVFNDFARFICSEAEILAYLKPGEKADSFSQVPACMQVLERLVREEDPNLRDLVSEAIETLSAYPHSQHVKKWAGPEVRTDWNSEPWG